MNIYQQNGFISRQEYLEHLSECYETDMETVEALASVLGPEEDFDGLVVSLEEYVV